MAYTAVATYVDGNLIDASNLNTYLRDNMSFFYSGIQARVYHDTTQSLTLATANKVLFNSESFDISGMHSTVSNTSRLTCVTAGVYTFYFNGEWATAPATAECYMLVNNTTTIAYNSEAARKRFTLISPPYLLAASDYVEVVVNPVTTQTLNNATNYSPIFGCVWHGAGS